MHLVHPARIELTLLVPETSVLSVELRVHSLYYTIKIGGGLKSEQRYARHAPC